MFTYLSDKNYKTEGNREAWRGNTQESPLSFRFIRTFCFIHDPPKLGDLG